MSSNLVVGTLVKIVTKNSPNYGRLECITEIDTSRSNRHWYFIEATRCWYPDNELEVVGVSDKTVNINKSSPSGWHPGFPEVNDMVTVNNPESKHHNRTFMVVEVDRERQGKKPHHFYKLSNNCWYSLEELIPATGMVGKTLDNPVVSDDDDVEDGDWEDEDNDSDDDLHDGNDVVDNDDPKFVIELRLNEIVHEAQMLRRKITRIQTSLLNVVEKVLPDMECEIAEVLKLAYNAKEVLDDLKIAD